MSASFLYFLMSFLPIPLFFFFTQLGPQATQIPKIRTRHEEYINAKPAVQLLPPLPHLHSEDIERAWPSSGFGKPSLLWLGLPLITIITLSFHLASFIHVDHVLSIIYVNILSVILVDCILPPTLKCLVGIMVLLLRLTASNHFEDGVSFLRVHSSPPLPAPPSHVSLADFHIRTASLDLLQAKQSKMLYNFLLR